MANHTVDDVYQEVADIKKKLEEKGNGVSQTYIDKKFEDAKEDPSQGENWAKALGLGLEDLVKTFTDFKSTSVAAWSGLGAVLATIAVGTLVDMDAAKKAGMKKINLVHDKNGMPRSAKKMAARAEAERNAPQAPITSIDTDRLKTMRKASVDLARSLHDLTADVNRAAQAIA
ncbi:hypothetical protein [Streptomyces sp. NPDC046939]|uniref:hypothetical protein n=1 Tax=Streptomyces sp. NPDC046939 TaxID=3155376 RepID=UPI0033F07703